MPPAIEPNLDAPPPLTAEGLPSPLQKLQDRARRPPLLRHPFRFIAWAVASLLSWGGLILFLALLSAVPLLNFVALGYMLDAQRRVALSGRFRDGFPLRPLIPRIVTALLGTSLVCSLLWILSGFARDAALIAPHSNLAQRWQLALRIFSLAAVLHLFGAWAYGASFTSFLRPLRNWLWILRESRQGTFFRTMTEGFLEFIAELRPGTHFRLGFSAFTAALIWLTGPTLLFASLRKTEGLPGLIVILGGILLALVLRWVPYLQVHLAVTQRWRSGFHLRTIRDLSRRAPWCLLLATTLTYALSIPLYLTTIVLPPRDALWMVNLLFVICIYPARLTVGWAYAQAARRQHPAHWLWRWSASLTLTALLGIYVFLLYFAQLIGQHGKLVLFEHPALLLPVPF